MIGGRTTERTDELIDTKYRQKIAEFARRHPDLRRCEAEQLFLLYCQQAAEQFDADPPNELLRQAAWRRMAGGPGRGSETPSDARAPRPRTCGRWSRAPREPEQ